MEIVSLKQTVGNGYNDFWNDKHRYRVLKGGKGSKKSATTALNLIYRILKYPCSNALVVRSVMNTHRDSTFAQLKWAQSKLRVSHLWRNTVSPLEMTYIPTGQKIIFRGFDDVLKLASTTVSQGYLCWVWVEEAYEIEKEADFDKLDLSVPRGEIPPHLFKQTTLTFNPWSEKHWLKSRFFDNPKEDTSTYSTNYLCNEFLDNTDRGIFERMKEQNPRAYEVAGLGNWGIIDGLVYENWVVSEFDYNELGKEYIGKRLVSDNSWQYKCFFGLDYGYTNDPTAFIAFAVNPISKEIYIFDEHYEKKMLNSDIANMIKAKGFAKERIRADCAEPKSNEDLRRMGIGRILPSVKGADSILNGIAKIQEYRIIVHPKCINTIAELTAYVYDEKRTHNGKVMPKDSENHLMDAFRYAFEDVKFFKPEDPSIRKKLSPEQRAARDTAVRQSDILAEWD